MKRVLIVVLDGLGMRQERWGNAVAAAHTPNLDALRQGALYTELRAHGTAVGLPSDADIGNSEVGHNALGGGRVVDQGAKLVSQALESGRVFSGAAWQEVVAHVKGRGSTLHFLGLLSDGNVHSHLDHVMRLLDAALASQLERVRLHVLLDGRDVAPQSALQYVDVLEAKLADLRQRGCDAQVASGGGRTRVTMDRYGADWGMVARGWQTHVHGDAPPYPSLREAIVEQRRSNPDLGDQDLEPFVIVGRDGPNGQIRSHDAVILFNFRGDRAIEISQAFEASEPFAPFVRNLPEGVMFAGMMQYDGDLAIPHRYLVEPPRIKYPLGEYLAERGCRQFACAETQKFGHVTYFWNGNHSGCFDPSRETYCEIASLKEPFDRVPWMKAREVTDATLRRLADPNGFDCARINFANPDMVGHTGDFAATVTAVSIVDAELGRLLQEAVKAKVRVIVTSDHGNSDTMFETPEPSNLVSWQGAPRYRPRTSHSCEPVPFAVLDPWGQWTRSRGVLRQGGHLGQVAATVLDLMELPRYHDYAPSLLLPGA